MKLLPLACTLALAVLVSGCGESAVAPDSAAPKAADAADASDAASISKQLDRLYADFWEASLKLNPIQATFIGDTRYNDQLPNFFSAEFRQQSHDFNQHWLDQVQAIDAGQLEGQARISYDIFVRDRQLALEGERFPDWMLPVNQFSSLASFIPMLGSRSRSRRSPTTTTG